MKSASLARSLLRFGLAVLVFVVAASGALFKGKFEDDRLTLLPERSRTEGEWRAGVDALKGNKRSGINIEIREDRSTWGFYLPTERAPRLEGKTSDGSPVHFVVGADSGDLIFDGAVKGKTATGRYV